MFIQHQFRPEPSQRSPHQTRSGQNRRGPEPSQLSPRHCSPNRRDSVHGRRSRRTQFSRSSRRSRRPLINYRQKRRLAPSWRIYCLGIPTLTIMKKLTKSVGCKSLPSAAGMQTAACVFGKQQQGNGLLTGRLAVTGSAPLLRQHGSSYGSFAQSCPPLVRTDCANFVVQMYRWQ